MNLRAALVLPLEEARLAELRARFDPIGTAMGIPLHITLLFPFGRDEDGVEEFFASWSPLGFSLTRVAEFPAVLWLAPEPDDELRARILELYARFRQWPPYGGEFPEPIPHATVGKVPEGESQADVAAAVRAAADPLLPVSFELREAALLAESAPDRWYEVRRFAFRGGA
ncbi:MAG TPA: 2'-5' RNA ligase family protein [Gaiellaceae bacterium]|nr:2'-5' RNA ligase family protein [Gaiellaceae bacterium]